MRSYIFSERERGVIREFLNGEVRITHRALSQIRTRTKTFKTLASDVDLYLELRRRLAESKPAGTA